MEKPLSGPTIYFRCRWSKTIDREKWTRFRWSDCFSTDDQRRTVFIKEIFSDHLKIPVIHFHIPPKPDASEDHFLIKKDKNPNTKGAELIFSEQQGLPVEAVLGSC